MDDKKFEIIKYIIIAGAVCFIASLVSDNLKADKVPFIKSSDIKSESDIKKVAENAGVSLSYEQAKNIQDKIQNTKPAGSVHATAGNVKQVAEEQRQQNGSDFAPVVADDDLSKLPDDTPIELKQYHIYAAPKVQHEVGVKLDAESGSHISGLSYGIKRRITEKGQYIGARLEYDWKDKEASVWATYTY